jgi:hypothetical protein
MERDRDREKERKSGAEGDSLRWAHLGTNARNSAPGHPRKALQIPIKSHFLDNNDNIWRKMPEIWLQERGRDDP